MAEKPKDTRKKKKEREIKRPGRDVSKKEDAGYEMVFDILLGIRNTVSRTETRKLAKKASGLEFSEITKENYPSTGSRTTPAHGNRDFVFRIRALFDIEPADYLMSLTSEYQLNELMSPGKSKSFFYYTFDMKYMIKTVKGFEAELLKKLLPAYYNHINRHSNTLLSRFYGFHAVKPAGDSTRYFVVMNNVFAGNLDLSLRYDLKGSTYNRTAFHKNPPKEGDDLSAFILKDLDFDRRIMLGPKRRTMLLTQLKADAHWLEQHNIMDYSLLLGIHFVEKGMPATRERRATIKMRLSQKNLLQQAEEEEEAQKKRLETSYFQQDLGGLQATDEKGKKLPEIYYMGIIDILQPYSFRKKMESKMKIYGARIPAAGLSAVGPHRYSTRFFDFLAARIGPGPIINLRQESSKKKGARLGTKGDPLRNSSRVSDSHIGDASAVMKEWKEGKDSLDAIAEVENETTTNGDDKGKDEEVEPLSESAVDESEERARLENLVDGENESVSVDNPSFDGRPAAHEAEALAPLVEREESEESERVIEIDDSDDDEKYDALL